MVIETIPHPPKSTYHPQRMPTLQNPFAQAAAQSVADILKLPIESLAVTAPPKPELGEFAVGCFPGAKLLKSAPAKLATQVENGFVSNQFFDEAKAAGPFVNFRVNRSALLSHVIECTLGTKTFISKDIGTGKTICVDYSSPNISKQLAYHHIRSTVIGQALCNMHRALGYTVVGINHLGDWGTTHGMLLEAFDRWGDENDLSIQSLNELYVRFRNEMKEDPSLADAGRAAFAKLESGDKAAVARWQQFKDISLAEFKEVYDSLGTQFDEIKGESEFLDDVPGVLEMLDQKKLSAMSEGALVIPFDESEDMPPLLLRKKDGATLYATRDIAAAIYRFEHYHFERSLYIVDRGQGLHFKQLFRALELADFEWSKKCTHIPFGLVRIAGKKTSTRDGKMVLLKDVFSDAIESAKERISQKNAEMPEDELNKIAHVVGMGAIVFANVMSERGKDVDFDLDDILSTDGDSGPYVQYAYARICRMFRKEDIEPSADVEISKLSGDHELQLALSIANFPDILARSTKNCDPHVISRTLIQIAGSFSRWYTVGNQNATQRILCEDEDTKKARLALAAATQRVLKTGLAILGVGVTSSM